MPTPRRILVYTPAYRLEPETVDAVLAMDRGPHAVAWLCDTEPGGGDSRQRILAKYALARDICIFGEYTDLMVVESDIVPPAHALTRLAELTDPGRYDDPDDAPRVAHGLYYFRRGWGKQPALVNAAKYQPSTIGPPVNLGPRELDRAWGRVVTVSGNGLGCTLIRAEVLQRIKFANPDAGHCDSQFSIDCLRSGIKMVCDLDVRCGHKRPDGYIIKPNDGDTAGYELVEGDPGTRYHAAGALVEVAAARDPDRDPDPQEVRPDA